jgi:hypothetical protein
VRDFTHDIKYGPYYTWGPDGNSGIRWQEFWPESDFPPDAICTCGHIADDHARFCAHCNCDCFQAGPRRADPSPRQGDNVPDKKGVLDGSVEERFCTCDICDPAQTGSVRASEAEDTTV